MPVGRTPFLQREGFQSQEEVEGPFDGVPDWLRPSLWTWVRQRLFGTDSRGRTAYADFGFIRTFERRSRFAFGLPADALPARARETIDEVTAERPEVLLAIVDEMIGTRDTDKDSLIELEVMLREAGSLWRVDASGPAPRLVKRLDPTAEAVARKAMAREDDAGQLLAAAWGAVFGREPNPSHGYREAVRAVEAAAGPVLLPADDRRTLGTMIAHLRDAEHKWTFVLPGHAGDAPAIRHVRQSMQLLWTSQYDRHVTEGTDLNVSPEEAEAAVPLAATLVHWFQNGHVRPATEHS